MEMTSQICGQSFCNTMQPVHSIIKLTLSTTTSVRIIDEEGNTKINALDAKCKKLPSSMKKFIFWFSKT